MLTRSTVSNRLRPFRPLEILRTTCLALAAATALVAARPASAAPEPASGATEVYVSALSTLTDLGFTVTPLGATEVVQASTLPNPTLFFPITGFDAEEVQIFHQGIGLALTDASGSVELTDFIVDGDDGVVLGNVLSSSVVADGAEIFAISDCAAMGGCMGLDGTLALDGLELSLTATAASVLFAEFQELLEMADLDEKALVGLPIGVANSFLVPKSVPEPGVGALLLGALGLLGLRMGRTAA